MKNDKPIILDSKERDIIYNLLEKAKPIPKNLMGELVMNIGDTAEYWELMGVEHKLKSSDGRYEPVSYEEYKAKNSK